MPYKVHTLLVSGFLDRIFPLAQVSCTWLSILHCSDILFMTMILGWCPSNISYGLNGSSKTHV